MPPKWSGEPDNKNYLIFDCETIAAGFADPDWVPNRVTCIAWSWDGEDKVFSATRREGVMYMFSEFLNAWNMADIVVAHNAIRFDLGVINSDLMRLKAKNNGVPLLDKKLVQDTIKLPKSKGFKKGLDDLAVLLDVPVEKIPLNHRQWEEAYDWDAIIEGKPVKKRDWEIIKDRCESDVVLLKFVRERLRELDMLQTPKVWKP